MQTFIRSNRVKLIALALSLFLHLLFFYSPPNFIPKLKDKAETVKVSMLTLPALPKPAMPAKPAPQLAKNNASGAPTPARAAPEPALQHTSNELAKLDAVPESGDGASVEAMPPARLPLSAKGQTQYTLYIGENLFEVGQVVHSWEIGEKTYKVSIQIDTTGLARAVHRTRYLYSSEGTVTQTGFRPDRYVYRTILTDRGYTFSADFDWTSNTVTTKDFSSQVRQYEVEENTHDWVTSDYQLSVLRPQSQDVELNVIRLDKSEKVSFENLGEESVEAAGVKFKAIHLRKKTDDASARREVWLAPDLNYLPVKVLWSDKERVYVQLISQIENTVPQ